nr:hypothetical protein [Tanacetum cinerariifolium]
DLMKLFSVNQWTKILILSVDEYSIQHREYLEKSSNAIAPVLPIEEPEYSLSMGYEYLNTTPETESGEIIKSGVKNLVPIPSEYEVTSDDESECDMPIKNDFSLTFTTFSNPLFNDNDDFMSSDDESLPDEDVPIEEFKYTLIDSSPKFDFLLKEFSELNAKIADTIVESFSPSPIPVEDINSLMDEIDLFLATDDLLPQHIESDSYNSEGDIHFLEKLLVNDSIPLLKNESFYFDHQDNLSFPHPPLKPPDVEFFFDSKPDVIAEEISDELNEDEYFYLGGEIDILVNVEDDDYFPFIFVIRIFLSYLIYPEVSPLLLSVGSEDTIYDPGISV